MKKAKLIIINKNIELSDDARIADNFITRVLGLLPRKDMAENEALVIRPCNSIHTFFMRFAIDVIFVDKNGVVLRVFRDVKSFRILPIIWHAQYVIEMKANCAKVEENDKFLLKICYNVTDE